MGKKKLSNNQGKVLGLLLSGENTLREIAKEVLGASTKESTVRNWRDGILKPYIDETLESLAEQASEEVQKEILDTLCESTEADVAGLAKRLRTAQRTNTQLRKIQRHAFDNSVDVDQLLDGIVMATSSLNQKTPKVFVDNPSYKAEPATVEILLSDLQIGKVSRYYNTPVAKKALKAYSDGIIKEINDRKDKYKLERVVVALIGDLVEDHMKHGVQSATACDTGLSEQIHDAIEGIWSEIINPLATLCIPMTVMCVTGNHGSSMHKGMDSFKAGRFSYDFVIHKTLERYSQLCNYKHVEFIIPDGTFGTLDIYGKHAIYEHGYHNPCTEKGMTDQMLKRGSQLKVHPSYWRQGDKHHHACFGQGEIVLNGAFFGIEQEGIEYSGILGFDSVPSQTIMFHVQDKRLGRGNIKEVINVQVHPDNA